MISFIRVISNVEQLMKQPKCRVEEYTTKWVKLRETWTEKTWIIKEHCDADKCVLAN